MNMTCGELAMLSVLLCFVGLLSGYLLGFLLF
jgi:hypothetical protein